MNKLIYTCLFFLNILSFIMFIIIIFYKNIIDDIFYLSEILDDSRRYSKLKNILTQSIYNLQLTFLIFDLIFALITLIFNNKKLSNIFGLNIDKIASQNSLGYSNLILEFFFSFMIKIIGQSVSLFLIILSNKEIEKLNLIEKDEKIFSLFDDGKVYLILLYWMGIIACGIYFILYVIKFIRIKKMKNKHYHYSITKSGNNIVNSIREINIGGNKTERIAITDEYNSI